MIEVGVFAQDIICLYALRQSQRNLFQARKVFQLPFFTTGKTQGFALSSL